MVVKNYDKEVLASRMYDMWLEIKAKKMGIDISTPAIKERFEVALAMTYLLKDRI